MTFKSLGGGGGGAQGHGDNWEMSEFFLQENSQCYFPFPCSFYHNGRDTNAFLDLPSFPL